MSHMGPEGENLNYKTYKTRDEMAADGYVFPRGAARERTPETATARTSGSGGATNIQGVAVTDDECSVLTMKTDEQRPEWLAPNSAQKYAEISEGTILDFFAGGVR